MLVHQVNSRFFANQFFRITPLKAAGERVILFQLDFCFRRKELRFRLRSWQAKPGPSSSEIRFCLTLQMAHFVLARFHQVSRAATPKGQARFGLGGELGRGYSAAMSREC
jgi:hypothetical protein